MSFVASKMDIGKTNCSSVRCFVFSGCARHSAGIGLSNCTDCQALVMILTG